MADSDFDNFLTRRCAAAEAYVNGDPAPLDQIVPTTGDCSFHSPSGETFSGAAVVADRYRKDAASFAPGSKTHLDILQQGSDGTLGKIPVVVNQIGACGTVFLGKNGHQPLRLPIHPQEICLRLLDRLSGRDRPHGRQG